MKSNILVALAVLVSLYGAVVHPMQVDLREKAEFEAALPIAKREYGKRDRNAYNKFKSKVKNSEFRGIPEMEAAREVLGLTPGEVFEMMK